MSREPLRVLQVLAPAPFGGLESVVRRLAALLEERGVETHVACVVTTDASKHPFVTAARSEGIRVHPIEVPVRGYARERKLVAALIAGLQPNVVHTHGYRCDIVDAPVARRAGLPMVTTAHGFTGNSTRNRLYEWFQRRAFRGFDQVIAVSGGLKDRLVASGVAPSRIALLPNARSASADLVDADQARDVLGLPRDRRVPVIGWVGRLGQEKGPDVAVSAFAHPDLADALLCFVGGGRMLDQCQDQAERLGIENRVLFAGVVADAGRLMRAFDVLCLSSRTEGTPMVLFEAGQAGLPVVATSVGGVPHVLGDGWNVVQPDDPHALGEALSRCIRDPSAAREAQTRAHARVEKYFDPARWAESHVAIYRSLSS